MTAGAWSFVIEQAADFQRTITWTTDAGTPIDLTGYTAKMTVKDAAGATIVALTTANGGITLGGAAGTVTLTIAAAATAVLAPTAGYSLVYDLELVAPNGIVTRLLQGEAAVSATVTG